jgi:RimJ/RimL family protein N-acetyltransferase
LIPLVRRGFAFVVGHFFQYDTYYLYEEAVENSLRLNEADFMPRIDSFTLKTISTNQEADELEAEGLEFWSHGANYRKRLDKGAIAFCVFVGQELASIYWVAMTRQAKDSLNERPYTVDFSNNEVCTGGLWTNPKYRGMGLIPYVSFKVRQFLGESGKVLLRGAITTGNVASQRAYAKLGPNIHAEARYLRILWWKSWKEKPLT